MQKGSPTELPDPPISNARRLNAQSGDDPKNKLVGADIRDPKPWAFMTPGDFKNWSAANGGLRNGG